MSRKSCLAVLALFCIGIISCLYFLGPGNIGNKDRVFHSQLSHMRASTYTVIGLCYYTREKKPGTIEGFAYMQIGRGVAFREGNSSYFLSVKHVFTFDDEIVDFKKTEQHFFIVQDWLKAKILLEAIDTRRSAKRGSTGLFSPKVFCGILKSCQKDFDKAGAIELDTEPAKKIEDEDIIAIPMDLSALSGKHYLSVNDFDLGGNYAYGRHLAIWGNPNSFGELYREGEIASPDFFNGIKTEINRRLFVSSIIVAHGDSGSPVFSPAKDGRIKIIGFCSMCYAKSPQLSIIYKATSFFDKLKLK